MAPTRLETSNNSDSGAFTLLELLCIVALVAVVAALGAGLCSHVQERGRQMTCLKNLRQIAVAVHLYANDHNGRFEVVMEDFDALLRPYTGGDQRIFHCPSAEHHADKTRIDGGRNDYALSIHVVAWEWGPNGLRHLQLDQPALIAVQANPARTLLGGDATGLLRLVNGSPLNGMKARVRHLSGANYVFMDGHAMLMTPEELAEQEKAFWSLIQKDQP